MASSSENGHMWKSVTKWITSLEVLPPNKINSCQDLAYSLRDGVILCHIASRLDEASISLKSINHKTQMAQFLSLQNIRLFLNACKVAFGLNESELFDPSMLWDFSDFGQVLQTLFLLSKSPKVVAARPDIQPCQAWLLSEEEQDEEAIYNTLEAEADEDTYQEFYYKNGGSNNYGYVWNSDLQNQEQSTRQQERNRRRRNYAYLYYNDEEKEEEIYADLGLVKKTAAASANLSSSSHHDQTAAKLQNTCAARLKEDWKFEPKEKRDFCLLELLETEANYVDVLNRLRKNFIRPITTIKESDKKIIFMNIKELGDIHTAFFTELFNCVKLEQHSSSPASLSSSSAAAAGAAGRHSLKLGDVFVEFKEKFLKYADYCVGLTHAQMTLENLCAEKKEVEKEIERCENMANVKRILLRDMLAVPMQRILKYHLLLDVMVKATPEQHDDYRSYLQAHEAMIDVAEYINEAKRDSELLHNLDVIQKSIASLEMPSNSSLKDYGRLRKDGELKVQSHDAGTGNKLRTRYIFLFDKLILMSKSMREDNYKLKELLRVSDYKVQDVPTDNSGSSNNTTTDVVRAAGRRIYRRDSSRWTHSFLLVQHAEKTAFTLFSRTAEEKRKWMEAFRETYDNAHLSKNIDNGHDLHMTNFEKPTSCSICGRLLKGLFFQGYNCLKCSRSVHQSCASKLPYCSLLEPPLIPPRPSSMQLPSVMHNGDSLDEGRDSADDLESRSFLPRQASDGSNSSLIMAPPASLPAASVTTNTFSSRVTHPDYINTRLEDHVWYVGDMSRDEANARLNLFPSGAFLVRCGRLGYALSLKTFSDVKHMKIDSSDSGEDENVQRTRTTFYFSENRRFFSIVELIAWYCRNSLKESFQGLDTILQFPIGELAYVEAVYEFRPSDEDLNTLPLVVGERLAVIDKLSDDTGWFKAHKDTPQGTRIGYIPKTFVVELCPY